MGARILQAVSTVSPQQPSGAPDSLAEAVECARKSASKELNAERRIEWGQFFTPFPVARLMAGMFEVQRESVRLLDPGAGIGTLFAAFVETMCKMENRPQTVNLV